jgi:hypothetical protein
MASCNCDWRVGGGASIVRLPPTVVTSLANAGVCHARTTRSIKWGRVEGAGAKNAPPLPPPPGATACCWRTRQGLHPQLMLRVQTPYACSNFLGIPCKLKHPLIFKFGSFTRFSSHLDSIFKNHLLIIKSLWYKSFILGELTTSSR